MNERDAKTRAETVGSLLRPQAVLDSKEPDQKLLDDAVRSAITIQEDAGLDIITDGEMRRYSWAQTPRFLDCFEPVGGTAQMNWRGGTGDAPAPPREGGGYPAVVRKVSQARRIGDMTDEYAFLARNAHSRTKYCMAAPSYHRRYWSPEHSGGAYDSAEEYLTEVLEYQREVVRRLIELGCDYIQLDAPNYGSLCDPDTRAKMAADGRDVDAELAFDTALDSALFDGITGVTRALHVCRGNGPGGRWHSHGGYGAISGTLFTQLDVDRLLLEYDTDRAGTFGPLADVRKGTVAVLGLLTTKDGALEDDDLLARRLDEAAKIKPLDELALSTQCGFASVAGGNPVTPEQQSAKLATVSRMARRVWG